MLVSQNAVSDRSKANDLLYHWPFFKSRRIKQVKTTSNPFKPVILYEKDRIQVLQTGAGNY